MRRYLTKTDPQTDDEMAVWGTVKGELQTGNCEGGRMLMTIDGDSQT